MTLSVDQLLHLTAKRGSRYGGGSAAALACAASAALLQKLLAPSPRAGRRAGPKATALARVRRLASTLVTRDAEAFGRVLDAYATQDQARATRALKRAIEIPVAVFESSATIIRLAEQARATINPRYQSDLVCVLALARAAKESAQAFIDANLHWLGDAAYDRAIRRQLAGTR